MSSLGSSAPGAVVGTPCAVAAAWAPQLAEDVVHELTNTLGALDLLVASFRVERTVDDRRLQVLERAILSMRNTVGLLADRTEPEHHLEATRPIAEMLEETTELLGVVASGPWLLRSEIDVGDGSVSIGRHELDQVLLNLVWNAREAMPSGGTMVLTATGSADEVVITLRDRGSGMDETTLQRAFDRQFSTKGRAGSGFGLAIAREIIERRGGSMAAASVLGEGSTFVVVLPFATAASIGSP